MNTLEILKLLKNDQAVGQIFLGVYPADMLPKITQFPAALIANLDPSTEPGTHWVSLYFNKTGICEYFDSFGRKPGFLERYILKNCKKYVYNNKQVQEIFTTVCGQLCIYVLLWRVRGVSFKEIVNSL
jgi:hypothetical protein